jgi:hypothetical protein
MNLIAVVLVTADSISVKMYFVCSSDGEWRHFDFHERYEVPGTRWATVRFSVRTVLHVMLPKLYWCRITVIQV